MNSHSFPGTQFVTIASFISASHYSCTPVPLNSMKLYAEHTKMHHFHMKKIGKKISGEGAVPPPDLWTYLQGGRGPQSKKFLLRLSIAQLVRMWLIAAG